MTNTNSIAASKMFLFVQVEAQNKVWWKYYLELYCSVFLVILGQVEEKRSELSEHSVLS
jgi:hypothetical protein